MNQEEFEQWVAGFQAMYQSLTADSLQQLEEWYCEETTFEDPMHKIEGLVALKSYFSNLYENLTSIHFDYLWHHQSEQQVIIGWRMDYSHTRLNQGKPISVEGVTTLVLDQGKVLFHKDYFDVGTMLYEHLPILGGVIRWIKKRTKAAS